jgi:hypothetical protein
VHVHTQPDGTTLGGKAVFQEEDEQGNIIKRCVPFKGNILFKEIDGEKIINTWNIHTQPDGTLAGRVEFQEKDDEDNVIERWVPFKGNALLKEIDSEKIVNTWDIHTLSGTNTLKGKVKLESGRQISFEWGKDGARVVEE